MSLGKLIQSLNEIRGFGVKVSERFGIELDGIRVAQIPKISAAIILLINPGDGTDPQ